MSNKYLDFREKYGTYILAPMVDQCDLPFRKLVRNYGVTLCYTQMFDSTRIISDPLYVTTEILNQSRGDGLCHSDRPLVVQIAGNDPATMLMACEKLLAVNPKEPLFDAIDINLGCPQERAKINHYGAYLLPRKEWNLVESIVKTLTTNLNIPIWCKIRLVPGDDTNYSLSIELAKRLEASGCSVLAVHGRFASSKKRRNGLADLNAIKAIRFVTDAQSILYTYF